MTNETKAKSNSVITTAMDGQVIVFHVKGAGELRLDMAGAHDKVRERAMIHGFIQKVSDRAAIPFNKETNQYATPAEKLDAMKGLVDHFMSGTDQWQPTRAEGTGRKPGGLDAILLAAVAEATGKDVAAVREIIKAGAAAKSTTPAAYLAALAGAGRVKPIVERMRAEAAKNADLDGDDLLEGL